MALYHTNTSGPDVDAVRAALRHAASLATKSEADVVLYVPSIKNFRHGTIEEAIGKQAVEALVANEPVRIGGAQVRLRVPRRLTVVRPSVTVACHLPSDLVEGAVRALTDGDLVFVPWAPEERDDYLVAHPDSQAIFPYGLCTGSTLRTG